jgi:putative tryptophan/tyrosine transport system substrate-binding protein
MNRRKFVFTASVALVGVPWTAQGQSAGRRLPRIAYLGISGPLAIDPRQIEGFKRGLVENGLIDGRNITVEYRWAEGSEARLLSLCTELARADLDVIVTVGTQAVRTLLTAGAKQPIVMAIISDPVGSGVIASLARPDGNVTGLSMLNEGLEAKRLEILKEVVPSLKRVLLLHDPLMNNEGLAEARTATRTLGVEALLVETHDPATFEATFAAAAKQGADGLSVMTSPFFNFNRSRLIELAGRHRLPSIWEASVYVRDGGLLSYGPNFADMYRRSAGYVARLLKGAKPADLPVEQPTLFELFVNQKTAKSLGIAIPQALLQRADEVIE